MSLAHILPPCLKEGGSAAAATHGFVSKEEQQLNSMYEVEYEDSVLRISFEGGRAGPGIQDMGTSFAVVCTLRACLTTVH